MKRLIPVFAATLIIGGITAIYFMRESPTKIFQPQTAESNGVTVTVKPLELSANAPIWKFEIALDTHSVELNDDMMVASVLVTDGGAERAPIDWEGDPAGGHHRKGTLSFRTISPAQNTVTLKIRGVGNMSERDFRWEL